MLWADSISKQYWQAGKPVPVLEDLSLEVEQGEFVALMGTSGTGKTTLMNVLGCLDQVSSGRYFIDGADVTLLDGCALAGIRNRKFGFVFQSSHFVDYLDLVENVALPGLYGSGAHTPSARARARKLLEQVGLAHRASHLPAALSGGERQRAAIARALFNRPRVILADEPTGNLDRTNAEKIMQLFDELNDTGITVVMVTHDPGIAVRAKRRVELADGTIRHAGF